MDEPPVRLLGRAVRHPDRAVLRLLLLARLAWAGARLDHGRFLSWVSARFNVDAIALHREYLESDLRREYLARFSALSELTGPKRIGTSGDLSHEILYILVRAAKPHTVVETGVLYGGSTAHLLAALERNGEGRLYSIDLPHEPGEPSHDFLIPTELRRRWTLLIGDSRRELPRLLEQLSEIDLFHHDSLHTFEHMTWEYGTVLPYLTQGGILSSHDVRIAHSLREIFRPNAFPTFCDHQSLPWQVFQNHGVALIGSPAREPLHRAG